jgi:hypothetical protein
MSDAPAVSLTLGQVVDLINRAKDGGANPIVVGMQILNNLGDDVNVTGSTLTLALTTSAIKIDPLFYAPRECDPDNLKKRRSRHCFARPAPRGTAENKSRFRSGNELRREQRSTHNRTHTLSNFTLSVDERQCVLLAAVC